jgi:hypothetical protein
MTKCNIYKGGANASYTPLIIAIKNRDVGTVRQLLDNGTSANEKDEQERWSPMKWATYVYKHSPGHADADNQARMYQIIELLYNAGAVNDFDSRLREDSYDFSPLIKEEEEDVEVYENAGGKRRRSSRKSKKARKSRKGKKSHKKAKRGSSTKRRKHMKK